MTAANTLVVGMTNMQELAQETSTALLERGHSVRSIHADELPIPLSGIDQVVVVRDPGTSLTQPVRQLVLDAAMGGIQVTQNIVGKGE